MHIYCSQLQAQDTALSSSSFRRFWSLLVLVMALALALLIVLYDQGPVSGLFIPSSTLLHREVGSVKEEGEEEESNAWHQRRTCATEAKFYNGMVRWGAVPSVCNKTTSWARVFP